MKSVPKPCKCTEANQYSISKVYLIFSCDKRSTKLYQIRASEEYLLAKAQALTLDASLSKYGFSRWCSGKESACQCRRPGFDPWVGKIPWRRKWKPTPVFLLGESHGQRSLASVDSQKVNMIERLSMQPHKADLCPPPNLYVEIQTSCTSKCNGI